MFTLALNASCIAAVALAASTLLAGCSGGGGGSNTPSPSVPQEASLAILAGIAPIGSGSAEAGYVDAVGAQARFSGISELAADTAGNVFVLEGDVAGNHAIRRITPDGAVTTLYAYGKELAIVLRGIALDDAGNVYVGYMNYCPPNPQGCVMHGEIHRIDPTGVRTAIQVLNSSDGSGTEIGQIWDIARDRDGNIFFTDFFAFIRRLSGDGDLTRFTTQGASITYAPHSLAVDDAGNVYTAGGLGSGYHIFKLDRAANFLPLPVFSPPGPPTGFGRASGLAVDGEGNVYADDPVTHVARKLSAAGVLSVVAGVESRPGFAAGPLPGLLNAPRGVALHGSDLYIGMNTAVAVVRNRP